MPFNSHTFIFGFLPLALLGFSLLRRRAAIFWLLACSLGAYAYAVPGDAPLLAASIAFNYAIGRALARAPEGRRKSALAIAAIGANLAVLAFYKYAFFAPPALTRALGGEGKLVARQLPLGISFFTFAEVAFLVDAWRGEAEATPARYALFVSYFPTVASGPIVRHGAFGAALEASAAPRDRWSDLSIGLTVFVIGLFKKSVIADSLVPISDALFEPAFRPPVPGFFEAWCGLLAYSARIYYDFSGYSDMAVGISRLFGIAIPFNFDSPYKAANILDFWRRWHITLSEWFRDYTFMPLSRFLLTSTGLKRAPSAAAAAAYLATFTLCGAWHGSTLPFVVWGAYHGALLGAHRFYNERLSRRREHPIHRWRKTRTFRIAAAAFTFGLVTLGWTFFGAESLGDVLRVWKGLVGLGATRTLGVREAVHMVVEAAPVVAALLVAWVLPSSASFVRAALDPAETTARLSWRPSFGWAAVTAALAVASLVTLRTTTFVYFKF